MIQAIRRFFLWYRLFTKRLLRRPSYLAVLLLVPLFAVALSFFARQDSGVLTVALVTKNKRDRAASAAVDRLLESDSVLRCELYPNEKTARRAVRMGKADAAWIFSEDYSDELDVFARDVYAHAVTVIEREDNVFLSLAREKLFAAVYPEVSYALFSQYLSETLKAGEIERSELQRYYASATFDDSIVRFETVDGREADTDGSYLTAPLRGIMGLLLLLCGMASGLYCYGEEQAGSFVWLSSRKRRYLPILSHITAIVPAAAAALAAMALGGVTVNFGRELLMMLLFIPSAALFCELLRCLCPTAAHYGALIPVLTVALLIFCPVFLDLNLLSPLRRALPLFWYLRAAWNSSGLAGMGIYLLCLLLPTALAVLIRQKILGL